MCTIDENVEKKNVLLLIKKKIYKEIELQQSLCCSSKNK